MVFIYLKGFLKSSLYTTSHDIPQAAFLNCIYKNSKISENHFSNKQHFLYSRLNDRRFKSRPGLTLFLEIPINSVSVELYTIINWLEFIYHNGFSQS